MRSPHGCLWSTPTRACSSAPATSHALVSHVDFLPTLASLVGAPASARSEWQGVDYSDQILAAAPGSQDYTVFTYDDWQSGQAKGPYPKPPNHVVGIREQRYKLARYYDAAGKVPDQWEMYDLKADPLERTNLAYKGHKRTATQEREYRRLRKKLAKVERRGCSRWGESGSSGPIGPGAETAHLPRRDDRRARGMPVQRGRRRADRRTMAQTPFACTRAHVLRMSLLAAASMATFWVGAPAAGAAPSAASWDTPQQRQVIAAGLLADSAGSFNGAGHLSAAQANSAMSALTAHMQDTGGETGTQGEQGPEGVAGTAAAFTAPAQTAQNPVSVAAFDRLLVEELGLEPVAAHVQATAQRLGCAHPPSSGPRWLRASWNWDTSTPSARSALTCSHRTDQPRPGRLVARRRPGPLQLERLGRQGIAVRVRTAADELRPAPGAPDRRVAIGYPYVWGGTTDNTADGLEHGGFDCSGFAWRVYKVAGLPWGREIGGRTAAEQAGEIPRSQRWRRPARAGRPAVLRHRALQQHGHREQRHARRGSISATTG